MKPLKSYICLYIKESTSIFWHLYLWIWDLLLLILNIEYSVELLFQLEICSIINIPEPRVQETQQAYWMKFSSL